MGEVKVVTDHDGVAYELKKREVGKVVSVGVGVGEVDVELGCCGEYGDCFFRLLCRSRGLVDVIV